MNASTISPTVSLIIAQTNLGKTSFILEKLGASATCIILPKEEHQGFKSEFKTNLDKNPALTLTDESDLDLTLKEKPFESVVFLSFAVWDDNAPAHLDSILALARFAVKNKLNVWAALEATSLEELTLLQNAVLEIADECSSAIFEEVKLTLGAGLLFTFSASQFCNR